MGQSELGQDRKVAALRILPYALRHSPAFFLRTTAGGLDEYPIYLYRCHRPERG